MKTQQILSMFMALLLSIAPQVSAQSSTTLVICLNRSTQAIKIKAKCLSSEVLVSGKNLTSVGTTAKPESPTTGNISIDMSACYQTSAKKSGSPFDGRIAVGLLCKLKTDLLLNDQFTSSESSRAQPLLESRRLVMNANLPNGVEYGLIASESSNRFYEVQVGAICCPTVTSK